MSNSNSFLPSRYQPELPVSKLILEEPPGDEAVPMDVLFVGGGPAGLSGAVELARLVKQDADQGGKVGPVEIGVLEKAEALGKHSLSGAVVNPVAFRTLFPDLKDSEFPFRSRVEHDRVFFLTQGGQFRIPTPPTMHNRGNYTASLCEIVRWLGERAEQLGINIFTGFPAASLLVEGRKVSGVRTAPAGLNRKGEPGSGYAPPTDLSARVTVLSEGTRGTLTQAYAQWQGIGSSNPQIFALGVKELWEAKRPLDKVIHTMGWPLPLDAFGGSWMYPMGGNLISLGLVVGLDYHQQTLDVHEMLQRMKLHPLFRQYLDGGELAEWGAKTIPEGGYYSLPDRLHGDGLLIAGDAAGFVNVPALKGIHYAMQSGILAARAIFEALKAGDTTALGLRQYDTLIGRSFIRDDLYRTRNMRLAFKRGFFVGGVKAALMSITGGAFPGGQIKVEEDVKEPRKITATEVFKPDSSRTFSKVDAVFRSANSTRDDIPSHLIVGKDVPAEAAEFYAHMCPAGVYERQGDQLVVNAPNCVDCKATDVIGPRWTPREGGSGPGYRRM